MTKLSSENLADLIGKRCRCLSQLRDLGHRQSELIAAGDMGAMLRLISAKNQIIVALQAIEKELAPFHQQDPETRKWTSAAARQKCAEQVALCREMLDEVMQRCDHRSES